MELNFGLPEKDKLPQNIIKVIGVGGGGSNTVNHMFARGIAGVDMMICNTDKQSLEKSLVPHKIHLGQKLVQGLGAGGNPEVGQKATKESEDEIREYLKGNTQMLFITAGMGGGTGTGGAPVIAHIAKEMGILTVSIVTTPFDFEGTNRNKYAKTGLDRLKEYSDTILIINNNKISQILGSKITAKKAFVYADDVLFNAAKGIAEIITLPGFINVDFEDVKNVMTNGGSAIMGTATFKGDSRAKDAVEAALTSPLLDNVDISGARSILVNVTASEESFLLDEFSYINNFVQERAGGNSDLFAGVAYDNTLEDELRVTVIATGFGSDTTKPTKLEEQPKKLVNIPYEDKKQTLKETFMVKDTTEVEEKVVVKEKVLVLQAEEKQNTIVDNHNKLMVESTEKKVFELYGEETPTSQDVKLKMQESFEKRLSGLDNDKSADYKDGKVLKELEEVPAYKRKTTGLQENNTHLLGGSKITLDEKIDPLTGEKKTILKENNSHLHDNVD